MLAAFLILLFYLSIASGEPIVGRILESGTDVYSLDNGEIIYHLPADTQVLVTCRFEPDDNGAIWDFAPYYGGIIPDNQWSAYISDLCPLINDTLLYLEGPSLEGML